MEKDAIFQKILDEGALIRLGPVIIMTVRNKYDITCVFSASIPLAVMVNIGTKHLIYIAGLAPPRVVTPIPNTEALFIL